MGFGLKFNHKTLKGITLDLRFYPFSVSGFGLRHADLGDVFGFSAWVQGFASSVRVAVPLL